MRALILGATGLVGQALWRDWKKRGWDVFGTFHQRQFQGLHRLDIRESAEVRKLIRETRPDAVVLAASNPYVDYCQKNPEETRKINVDAALQTAKIAGDAGARFVFFSTDYVFDGKKQEPYVEEDAAHPLNKYGEQKVEAEERIQKELRDFLILRISGVFGWELSWKNFVLQLLLKLWTGKEMRVAEDLKYHPTYAPDLGPALAELLAKRAAGIYHAAGASGLFRHDFAIQVAEIFGQDKKFIKKWPQAKLSDTKRPLHSCLDMGKLSRVISSGVMPGDARSRLMFMKEEKPSWEEYLKEHGEISVPVERA